MTTNDPVLHAAICDRRNYGFSVRSCQVADRPAQRASASLYECNNPGLNGKLTEFAAILGIRGLASLDGRVRRRNEIASRYRDGLGVLRGLSFQRIARTDVSTWKDFVVVVDEQAFGMNRDELRERLDALGIETASYFCPAVHQFEYFRRFQSPAHRLTETERLQARILSLPIYSGLSDGEQDEVIACIRECGAGMAD